MMHLSSAHSEIYQVKKTRKANVFTLCRIKLFANLQHAHYVLAHSAYSSGKHTFLSLRQVFILRRLRNEIRKESLELKR
jgi:hypothetical protein